MILDASAAESLALFFSSLQRTHCFSRADLQCRHNELQASLQRLSAFFSELAWKAYGSERSLTDPQSQQALAASKWTGSGYVSGSLDGLLKGKKLQAHGTLNYQAGGTCAVKETRHLYGFASAALLPVGLQGEATAVLKDSKGTWNPSVRLGGSAGAAVFHGQVNAGFQFGNQNAGLQGSGQLLTAYGRAEGIFQPDEILVDLAAGAAAVRGECSVVAELFGYRITAGLSGSVGSAEAGLGFQFSTREWSFGCKLGFIVGAGFKIRVEKIR